MKRPLSAIALALFCACTATFADDYPLPEAVRRNPEQFPWVHSTLGIDHSVPAPFEPVRVDGLTATLWGRSFTWGEGFLPRRIVSQGVEILAEPMRLDLSLDGVAIAQLEQAAPTRVVESHPDRVDLAARAVGRSASVDVRSRLEFDGFLRVDITITPTAGRAVIDRLAVDIPYNPAVATFMRKAVNYDYATEEFAEGSGPMAMRVPDGASSGPFSRFFWIGNEQVGAELVLETNRHFSPIIPRIGNAPATFQIDKDAQRAILRVNMALEPKTLTEAVTYSFGLYVNPVKPLPDNFRAIYFMGGIPRRRPEGLNPQMWTFSTVRPGPTWGLQLRYAGLPEPAADPERRAEHDAVVADMRRAGLRVVPYAAIHAMHANVPALKAFGPYWIAEPWETSEFRQRIEAAPLDDQRMRSENLIFYTTHHKSVQDLLLWHYDRAASSQYGFDGLYFDHASHIRNVTNPLSGAQADAPEGVEFYPMFQTREFHKRLFRVVKGRNPEFLILQHGANPPLTFCGFSDYIFTGEGLNRAFRDWGRQAKRAGELPEYHPPYLPDYSKFDDDFWFAFHNQTRGFTNAFLPNITKRWFHRDERWNRENPEWIEKWPEYERKYTRVMFSRVLQIDTPVWHAHSNGGLHRAVYQGFEKIGGLGEGTRFVGSWESETIGRGQDGLKLAAYVRKDGGKAMLLVSNWTKEPIEATITLNFEGLDAGFGRIAQATCGLGEGPIRHTANTVTVRIEGDDFKMIVIE